MTDKKQHFIILLLAVILITVFFQNRSLRRELDNTNLQLQTMKNDFYYQISNMSHSIPQQIKNVLNEVENKVSEYEFTVKSINPKENNAELSLDFTLKSVDGNSNVFVLYKAKDNSSKNNNWKEVLAEKSGELAYTASLNLSLKDNYDFRFVEKGSNGSASDLSTSSVSKNLYTEFYENRTHITSSGRSESRETLGFDFAIENNTFGLEEYKIKSVVCKLYYKGTLFYNKDITLLNLGSQEEVDRYNLQVASGQIEPNKTMKPFGEAVPNDGNREKMYFRIVLNKEELTSEHPDLFSIQDGFSAGNRSQNASSSFSSVESVSSSREVSSYAEIYKYELIITYNSGETMTI